MSATGYTLSYKTTRMVSGYSGFSSRQGGSP